MSLLILDEKDKLACLLVHPSQHVSMKSAGQCERSSKSSIIGRFRVRVPTAFSSLLLRSFHDLSSKTLLLTQWLLRCICVEFLYASMGPYQSICIDTTPCAHSFCDRQFTCSQRAYASNCICLHDDASLALQCDVDFSSRLKDFPNTFCCVLSFLSFYNPNRCGCVLCV